MIGGDCDLIVGSEAVSELAALLPNSQTIICKGYGHSALEEYKDFNGKVLSFLKEQ